MRRGVAIGRKPKHVPNNKEEIVRIIEGEKAMSWTERTQEEKDMLEPIGEKPWPLRLAIPAMFKRIGKIYVTICTGIVSYYIVLYILVWLGIGG